MDRPSIAIFTTVTERYLEENGRAYRCTGAQMYPSIRLDNSSERYRKKRGMNIMENYGVSVARRNRTSQNIQSTFPVGEHHPNGEPTTACICLCSLGRWHGG